MLYQPDNDSHHSTISVPAITPTNLTFRLEAKIISSMLSSITRVMHATRCSLLIEALQMKQYHFTTGLLFVALFWRLFPFHITSWTILYHVHTSSSLPSWRYSRLFLFILFIHYRCRCGIHAHQWNDERGIDMVVKDDSGKIGRNALQRPMRRRQWLAALSNRSSRGRLRRGGYRLGVGTMGGG